MKKLKQWVTLVGLAGPMLFGMSCASQLKDAVSTGVLDFVTGSTTDTLGGAISFGSLFGG